MKRFSLFLFFLCACSCLIRAQYVPDYLGDDYEHRTFQMPDDYSGKVVCTLTRKPPVPGREKAILYIHGYNDYFFQKQLGDSIHANGYNFYALDLRKYGRSILAGQDTFFVKNLNEYFADIDTALHTIRSEGNTEILLMAHSTGGLITPLYLHSKGNSLPVKALILNSPFLDMNMSGFMENVAVPVVSFLGKFFPYITVEGRSLSMYAESLLKQYHGEWTYKTNWKLTYGHPIQSGWIRAIHLGQNIVHKGIDLPCPVLVMSSDKSIKETSVWNNDYLKADIVLDVEDIQKYGARLGKDVTRITVHDGIHDLILSPLPARNTAYQTIFSWIKEKQL